MKTTNSAHSKTSIWLGVLFCMELVFCVALTGCGNDVLRDFDRLEKEALKYGTVSVGAARVVPYDSNDLKKSRKRLINALRRMRRDWLKNPKDRPQAYLTEFLEKQLKIAIDLYKPKLDQKPEKNGDKNGGKNAGKSGGKNGGKKSKPDPNEASKFIVGLSEALDTIMKNQPPRPSEIELIGFYMAAQKFVESELEELKLGKPVDSGFDRFVVSLDLTAWVRGKAVATLVYIDLYPYNADRWCDEAAKILRCWWNGDRLKNIHNCKELKGTRHYECCWKQVITKEFKDSFKSFERFNIMKMPTWQDIDEEHDPDDWVGFCHRLLDKHGLFPHIVQVERMDIGERLILGEGSYSETGFQLGGSHPVGLSGSLEMKTKRKTEGLTAKVQTLSLAFVAGERRAGWLFMPGKTTEGRMRPTERRLRMVVDVPKEMDKLTIHVHKVFLGPDLGILPDASFKDQMINHRKTRDTLIKTNKPYKDCEATESSDWYPRHYRLIKTRIRNLLYQGWSEEFVVDIPKSKN